MYYELYVSDDLASLFNVSSLVYSFDNSVSPQLAHLHTLAQPVKGQYVGFRMTAGAWQQTRLSELGVYGSFKLIAPIGAAQLTKDNISLLPADNLLSSASMQEGEVAWNTQPQLLTDGFISTINTDATDNICSFVTTPETITLPGGQPLTGYEGVAQFYYKLENDAKVKQFLVAGSGGDDPAYVDGDQYTGTGIDNRHVLYYEIYAAETDEELFHQDNLVWKQDNSVEKALAQLITLETALDARYVGFRVTGGAYGLARLSEVGVYGEMARRATLTFTPFDTQTEMNALVGDSKNLIKGQDVENNYAGYLKLAGTAEVSNEKWLSDGFIHWTDDGEDPQKASYGNTNMDAYIYYDMRGTVSFTGILLANDGAEEATYRLQKVTVYVSDDESALFASENCVGTAPLAAASVGAYIDLSMLDVQGRYIGFDIPGDEQYRLVRLAELGIYGSYVNSPEPLPKNLLIGAIPTETFQTDARGLDNLTAVDAEGNPGTGNSGTVANQRDIMDLEPMANLTDGDIDTRAAQQCDPAPDLDVGESRLSYQTPWMVYIYHLGGEAKISSLELASSNEPDYQISGVQFYASYAYADLFKNDSLLYTTGGERYVATTDAITGETMYLPDMTTDMGANRTIGYQLNAGQANKTVRFVAVVITRPYALYSLYPGAGMRPGYNQARASEFTVIGELLNEDEPIASTYSTTCSLGKVSMTIKPFNFDDRAFFEQTVGGITVTESRLPSTVKTTTDNYLLSVDGDTVYRVRLVDKKGNLIPDTGEDDLTALNGRDVEIRLPAVKDYVQTVGVVEGNTVRRLFNAYRRADTDYINAGMVGYPKYSASKVNNRHLATLQTTDVSLVYLKMNSLDEVKQLSGDKGNPSLYEFTADSVAGISSQAEPRNGYLICLFSVLIAAVAAVLWYRVKKGGVSK